MARQAPPGSTTVSIRMPHALADTLAGEAKRRGRTRSTHALRLLQAALAGDDEDDAPTGPGDVELAVLEDFADLEAGDSRLPMAVTLARTADVAARTGDHAVAVSALRELRQLRAAVAAEQEEAEQWSSGSGRGSRSGRRSTRSRC